MKPCTNDGYDFLSADSLAKQASKESPVTAPSTPEQELLARRDTLELTFIRHRTSGTVHVIVPTDPDAEDEPTTDDEFDWIGWVVAARLTLCGYVARINLGGVGCGDKPVECFADEQLCRRCVRALGPHSSRAFEHPLPVIRPAEFREDHTMTKDQTTTECVHHVRLFGESVRMAYLRHEDEWRRRAQHGLGAIRDLGVLDVLMDLPAGMPVPWRSLGHDERRVLLRLPDGVVDRTETTVTRRMVPAVTPLLATVVSDNWGDGSSATSGFAVYCPRMVLLTRPPADEDRVFVLSEASFYGIGVAVDGEPDVLIGPEPILDWQITPASWEFSEAVYHQVYESASVKETTDV